MPLKTVEDIIRIASGQRYVPEFKALFHTPWFMSFVQNVNDKVLVNAWALTTEQVKVAMKILAIIRPYLIARGLATKDEIDALALHPRYEQEPRKSKNVPREARHIGGNLLALRFKFDETVRQQLAWINEKVTLHERAYFTTYDGLWIVPLTRRTIGPVMELLAEHCFKLDEATNQYLDLCLESEGAQSTFEIDPETDEVIVTVRDNELLSGYVRGPLQGERA